MTLIGTAYNLAPIGAWFPPFIETAIAASIFYMAIEGNPPMSRFAVDSPVEEAGFEPSVPPEGGLSCPGSGRTRCGPGCRRA